MSSGPIQTERDLWRALVVSTPNVHRICFAKGAAGYCGRTSARQRTNNWAKVVCWDCRAAALADGLTPAEPRG